MDITLVILAAGIGARYGAGIKQLAKVGPTGEIIMDYSIHDAIQAGFNRVVFIIRREIYDEFREAIGNRLEEKFCALGVKWGYAFQELTDPPVGRTKPWGTGQAILCCRELLTGPFAVINADDYYGKSAYAEAYEFLSDYSPAEPYRFGMVGFDLKNTLSDAGGVTRGVCRVDENGQLVGITETRNIVRTSDGPAVQTADGLRPLDENSFVSMNLWMLTPAFVNGLEQGFADFRANMADPLTEEYLLPEIIDKMLWQGIATVQVLPSEEKWFGVTYREDREIVARAFQELIAQGVYNEDLFSDL